MTKEQRRDGEMSLQYTVKEILSRIEVDIKSIMVMLQNKAERADLEILKARVELIEKRGSEKAQQAEQKVEQLELEVQAIKQDNSTNENVQKNKEAWEKTNRDTKWIVVAIVVNSLIAILAATVGLLEIYSKQAH